MMIACMHGTKFEPVVQLLYETINNVELFNRKINSILDIKKVDNQIIIRNGSKQVTINLFDKIRVKTSILNYQNNLFDKIKFYFIEPDIESILL